MESNKKNKKVLIFADWYEPGYKAGGPIRSCVNFTEYMQDDFDIYVYTRDRDFGNEKPYPGIEANIWHATKRSHVFYASPEYLSWKHLYSIIRTVNPDFVYINSMYSKHFSLYPVLMKRIGLIKGKVVLAPRGMLKESALQFKTWKKNLFLKLFKTFHLHSVVRFQATDGTERQDIVKNFGSYTNHLEVPNFPSPQKEFRLIKKVPGAIKIVFIGRIHPIKNLHFLLECIEHRKAEVFLTIIGSMEDDAYWQKCTDLIALFPGNIKVDFQKGIPHAEIEAIVLSHHIFALPSEGENFGHAIFEALAMGRPVLISDQTPWRDLTKYKAGWDVRLGDSAGFSKVLDKVAMMDNTEYQQWSEGAWRFAKEYQENSQLKERYIELFSQ